VISRLQYRAAAANDTPYPLWLFDYCFKTTQTVVRLKIKIEDVQNSL
jgi:hypothetical protein